MDDGIGPPGPDAPPGPGLKDWPIVPNATVAGVDLQPGPPRGAVLEWRTPMS